MPSRDGPEPRRLLHIFSTFGVGGPQVRFATLANRLGRRYRHSIAAMDGDHSCAERLDRDLDVTLLPLPVVKGGGLSLRNLQAFRGLIRALRPDLLLTYNWGTIVWALAHRLRPLCPHLHFEDGFGPDEAGGAQLARRVWLRRIALTGGHTRIVVPSQMLREIARERWGFSIRRVLHLANGVDLQRFAAPQKTAPLPVPAGAPVIGSVGALRPEKNFARLLRAVAAIGPDHRPHLVLVGEGPERGALERLAGQLGIADRTHLIGRVERPETVLGAFTIYALSSDTEQMPISLLEAMAAGLPAVATNVGDVRDMLAPPNRPMVVQSADEQGFAKALSGLLGDGALRAEIGQANRERACEHFGEDHMVESYRCLFEGRAANSEQGRR